MARHVGVAALPVNNRPETGKPSRWSFPTAAGWFFVLMKDRRPGRRPRSRRRAVTHNQRPWLWVPAFPGTTRAELAARRRTVFGNCQLTMSNSPSRSRGAFLRPGFATSLHSPRIEGWAERRETFGCSGTRWACPRCVEDARERAYDAARQAL